MSDHTAAEIEWLRGERDRLAADLAKAHKDALAWMEKVHQPAAEIARLRGSLKKIAAMRPPIPEDAEGNGPNWEQYIYTRTWALFAASLQDTARAALGGER